MTIKYSEDHEWVELSKDGVVTVGITEFAQEQLGDLVFIELPGVSDEVSQGDNICVIESVKAASDLIAPVSGELIEVNDRLNDEPELASEDPLAEGWFVKIQLSDTSEFDALMDGAAYQEFIEE
jgi:glycine cleavage system H protein